jgi:hypothetical protein
MSARFLRAAGARPTLQLTRDRNWRRQISVVASHGRPSHDETPHLPRPIALARKEFRARSQLATLSAAARAPSLVYVRRPAANHLAKQRPTAEPHAAAVADDDEQVRIPSRAGLHSQLRRRRARQTDAAEVPSGRAGRPPVIVERGRRLTRPIAIGRRPLERPARLAPPRRSATGIVVVVVVSVIMQNSTRGSPCSPPTHRRRRHVGWHTRAAADKIGPCRGRLATTSHKWPKRQAGRPTLAAPPEPTTARRANQGRQTKRRPHDRRPPSLRSARFLSPKHTNRPSAEQRRRRRQQQLMGVSTEATKRPANDAGDDDHDDQPIGPDDDDDGDDD